MKIENYISALLYRYQCVTVPGFGAFLTAIQSAQLNGSTNTFYPPKKLVSFNPHLKNNDGLLANHIALQEKISYDDAVIAVQHEVNLWIEKLQRKESLQLLNIGEISVNSEWNWVFEPITSVNYLADSFGLSSIVSPAVKREVLKAQVEALEEKAPIVFTPERKRDYSFLKYAAIFVVSMGVGGAAYKSYYDQQITSKNVLVAKAVQEKVQDKIQQATFFIESPLPPVTLNIKETKTKVVKPYHIMAGAFRSEANAERIFKELQSLGFEPVRLERNTFGLYPVLYGSFTSYAEAQTKLKEIHKNHNKEAWVLIKEL
ncbi:MULTISPECIES: SPOR domain-containing protein [unclassified Flavobacterium]|uniref:HU domain-containing protein n=1 Tax=unclassified Flavobacterium TaxID=196869 RepID=UPI00086E4C65|nr:MULTISPECIES: SPOR domain-containing protein [unclassified Flavobacterium]MBN9283302.1 SPOR domain-containing protein [Flavobacterium sp.]ODS80230.1 MAG: sporulation protein [Chryseobacterium sp. SCN 40-13]OJV68033.1 MAG: sporulation protein [Flavobacterium sp. 40-81]